MAHRSKISGLMVVLISGLMVGFFCWVDYNVMKWAEECLCVPRQKVEFSSLGIHLAPLVCTLKKWHNIDQLRVITGGPHLKNLFYLKSNSLKFDCLNRLSKWKQIIDSQDSTWVVNWSSSSLIKRTTNPTNHVA